MPLQKQNVPLVMKGGIDTKDDERVQIPVNVRDLTDALFDDGNTLVVRPGQSAVTVPASFNENAIRGFVFRGQPAVETVGGKMFHVEKSGLGNNSQFGAVQNAATAGQYPSNFPRAAAITRRAQSMLKKATAPAAGIPFYDLNFDCAESLTSNTYCLVWEEPDRSGSGRQGVRVSIRTRDTDTELQYSFFTGAGLVYVKPRVVYAPVQDRYLVFFGRFTSGLGDYVVNSVYYPADGSAAATAEVTALTCLGGGAVEGAALQQVLFDVSSISSDNTRFGVCAKSTAQIIQLAQVSVAGAVVAGPVSSGATNAVSMSAGITFSGGVWRTHCFTSVAASVISLYFDNGGAIQGPFSPVSGTLFGKILLDVTANALTVVLDNWVSNVPENWLFTVSTAHVLSGAQTIVKTGCVISGRFLTLGSRQYLPITRASNPLVVTGGATLLMDVTTLKANASISIANSTPHYIARLDTYNSYRYANLDYAHRVPACLSDTFFYLKYETDLLLAGGTNDTAVVLAACKLDPTSQLGFLEANGSTFLAGACPLICDGQQIFEEGFNFNPEIVSFTQVAAGTGYGPFNGVGTYSLCFTEAFQDAAGNWYESAPSNIITFTTTAPLPNVLPVVSRPTSLKDNGRRRLLLYRTLATSTDPNFYLGYTELGNNVTDTQITTGGSEVLYSQSRPTNDPAPPCRQVSYFQRRLVLAGCGDGQQVFWSQQIDPGFSPAFNVSSTSYQQTIPNRFGRIVGTNEMDGKLVVLGEEQIGYILGVGPDSTGLGEYSAVETVIQNQGCQYDSPRSIGLTTEGVWFRSPVGIRVLGRNGQILEVEGTQLGAQMDRYVVGPMTYSAGGATQLIRFYCNGSCFIFDTQWNQWSRFTQFASVDAVYAPATDRFYHFYQTLVRYYDPTTTVDVDDSGSPSVPINALITTAPFSFAGVQGYQRVYEILALFGTDQASAVIQPVVTLQVAYDFGVLANEATSYVVPVNATGRMAQMRHRFVTQKCQSMRFTLAIFSATGRPRLSAVTLQVGVKNTPFRTAQVA